MISKKYIMRILSWGLLIIALSIVTYYDRMLFIKPLKEDIVQLKQDEINTNTSIKLINANIERYNALVYDNNTFESKIPPFMGEQEIQQKYMLRPISVANAKLLSASQITDGMPSNLKLSNNISAKKVSLVFQIDDLSQFNTFVDELTTGMRSIYIGNFQFKLPGENTPPDTPIQVTIDYYVFYTK